MGKKKDAKDFHIFCHTDEEGNPVVHKITINEAGSVKIHDHPELQSEVYYHLLMIQKAKADPASLRHSYRGYYYPVKGCLQFYFSLIHRKFDEHIRGINFETINENHLQFNRYDNERIEDYLDKIKLKTCNRVRFDRDDVWSERVFLIRNLQKIKARREGIVNQQLYDGIERFDRYSVNFDLTITEQPEKAFLAQKSFIVTDRFTFRSYIGSRCSTSRIAWKGRPRSRDGFITVSVTIDKNWFKEVYKPGLAVIKTEKHGKFFVLQATPAGKDSYFVDGIVPNSGTQKKYKVQKYHITKNPVDGSWDVKRKNRTRQ